MIQEGVKVYNDDISSIAQTKSVGQLKVTMAIWE